MADNRFDEKAQSWDNKPERRKLADTVARSIMELPLDKQMIAMEFGCGTGLVGLQLAPLVGSLTAVDSSAGMIEVLKNKVTEQGLGHVIPIQGDILTLSMDDRFDVIFTSMTLHHIEKVDPILKRLHQLLKTDGLLAIADLDHEDGSFHRTDSGEKHHGFKRSDLTSLLVEIGFAPPEFRTIHNISKTDKEGNTKDYDIFLGVTHRP